MRKAAALAVALALLGCAAAARDAPPADQVRAEAETPPSAAPQMSAADGQVDWAAVPRPAAFRRCAACHNAEPDAPHLLGPNLYGAYRRQAASAPGYDYSAAMRGTDLVWDETTLDRFLAAPQKLVPGTRMTLTGVGDEEERKAVIAFLRARAPQRP